MKNIIHILLFLPFFGFSQSVYEQAEKAQSDNQIGMVEYPVTFLAEGKEEKGYLQDVIFEENGFSYKWKYVVLTPTDIYFIEFWCPKITV